MQKRVTFKMEISEEKVFLKGSIIPEKETNHKENKEQENPNTKTDDGLTEKEKLAIKK